MDWSPLEEETMPTIEKKSLNQQDETNTALYIAIFVSETAL
jgi:hypothetical protein